MTKAGYSQQHSLNDSLVNFPLQTQIKFGLSLFRLTAFRFRIFAYGGI